MVVQGYAGDVDRLKPGLDFGFSASADVDQDFRVQDEVLLILGEAREIHWHLFVIDDCELPLHEAAKTGDALLAIEDFELAVGGLVEVDETQRVALQERVNDRSIATLLGIDVIALVLRLNGQLAGETIETLAFELVVGEVLDDVADGVALEFSFHFAGLLCLMRMR